MHSQAAVSALHVPWSGPPHVKLPDGSLGHLASHCGLTQSSMHEQLVPLVMPLKHVMLQKAPVVPGLHFSQRVPVQLPKQMQVELPGMHVPCSQSQGVSHAGPT